MRRRDQNPISDLLHRSSPARIPSGRCAAAAGQIRLDLPRLRISPASLAPTIFHCLQRPALGQSSSPASLLLQTLPTAYSQNRSVDRIAGSFSLVKPKLEQFAVDTRRTPELVISAHLPDQRAQFYLDLWAPSPRARFPAPITAKAGPMPTHERFRLNNRHDLQDRWKPAIHPNEEPAIVVRKMGSASHLPLQND